jgi:hypothetical protein
MKRMAALLAVAGLMAATVPATAGAAPKPVKCGGGGHLHLFGQNIPFPVC